MGIFQTIKNLIIGKADQLDEKLIADNPILIMDRAIEEAKKGLIEQTKQVGEVTTQVKRLDEDYNKKLGNLREIQARIGIAQRKGAEEDVKQGMALYKQRETELFSTKARLDSIKADHKKMIDFLASEKERIGQLESEKASVIADLEISKAKEKTLGLQSTLVENKSVAASFDKVKAIAEKKRASAEGLENTIESVDNSSSSKSSFFKGL